MTKKIFNLEEAAIKAAVAIVATVVNKEQQKPFLYEALLNEDAKPSRFFKMFLGTNKVPAASVQAWGNNFKINPRGKGEVLMGEINKIGVNYTLGEADLFDMRNLPTLAAQEQSILNEIYADAKNGVFAVKQRLEAIMLQTLSSTKTILNSDNNPDGLVRVFDYQVPTAQKEDVATVWSDVAAKGLAEISTWVQYMRDTMKINPAYILTDNATITNLLNQTATKAEIFQNTIKTTRSELATKTVALEDLNAYMAHFDLPQLIKITDDINYRKADGSIDETARGWGAAKLTIIPEGKLGRTQYMPAMPAIGNPEYIQTQSGIFTIKQSLNSNSDSEEMKTNVNIPGYPVLDRAHDLFYVNTNSTSGY